MEEKSRLIIEIPAYMKRDLKIKLKEFHKVPVSVTGFIRDILTALDRLSIFDFDVLLDDPENYMVEALRAYLPSKHTRENLTDVTNYYDD